MAVSREGFGLLTDALSGLAAESSAGRIAFVLEGGYDLPALRNGVREVLDRLSRPAALLPDPAVSEETRRELEPCFQVFRSYWDL